MSETGVNGLRESLVLTECECLIRMRGVSECDREKSRLKRRIRNSFNDV